MDRIYVFFVGSAGSGKTYLTKAFSDYLEFKRIDHIIVNLDPGAGNLPYSPDIDVREWFSIEDVMEKYDVGPNGAQIIASDLIATKVDDIIDEIDLYNATYVLMDTPGQMELFTLRASSEVLIGILGRNNCVSVFLFDPVVSQQAPGFLSLVFLYSSAIMRLNIPQIPVLSKVDILPEHTVKKILEWSKSPETLHDSISRERGLSPDLFNLLYDLGLFRPLIPVSSKTGDGMDDIYEQIQEIYYGGEDIERILF